MPPMTPRAIFFVHLRGGGRKSLLFFLRGKGWGGWVVRKVMFGGILFDRRDQIFVFRRLSSLPPNLEIKRKGEATRDNQTVLPIKV